MSNIYNGKGEVKGKMGLPVQFNEEYRPNLIKRAVLAIQTHQVQPQGVKPGAGKRHSAYKSKRRHEYRTTYGFGNSRTPGKVMSAQGSRFNQQGANVPNTVGGRVAHPPRVEKKISEKINAKERKKAIRSAISATAVKEIIEKRGHKVNDVKEFPLILTDDIEKVAKASEAKKVLEALGLKKEIERTKIKKIRAGRGKTRGRKYKRKIGPLFIVSKKCELEKSAKNIAGVEIIKVKDLNASSLAPGTHPGRLTIWSESAIKTLESKNMFM